MSYTITNGKVVIETNSDLQRMLNRTSLSNQLIYSSFYCEKIDWIIEYAKKIESELKKHKVRVELDESNEKIGYKIRKAQLEKVPYMLVLGAKEQEGNLVAVRSRKDGDLGQMKIDEFVQKIQREIENKVIE